MKKAAYIIIGLAIATIFYSCEKSAPLSGTVNGVSSGKIYLQKFDEKVFINIDSVEIKDGKFAFPTQVPSPEVYGLSLDPKKGSFLIFLDKNQTQVALDSTSSYQNTTVKGSALHDEYVAYKKEKNVDIKEYVKAHPTSLVTAYILYREYSYRLSPEEIKENVALLEPELQETPYAKTLNKLATVFQTVAVGKKAPEFGAKTPDGQIVKLGDKLGKGYLLVDFWASWCPPCRKENPNLVRIYDKYKDKGFDIFAVSLDKSKEDWVKAIEKDNRYKRLDRC